MKKIVMTMVALLSMTVAMAQPSDNQQQRREFKKPSPEQMAEFMARGLGLTDAQKKQVAELNKEYEDVLGGPRMRHGGPRGPRPDGETGATKQDDKQSKKDKKVKGKKDKAEKQMEKGDRPQRPELTEEQKAEMKQRMEKRQEYDGKLKKILTDEQYEKYQQMNRRGFGRGHGGPGRQGGHRPNGPRPETSQND